MASILQSIKVTGAITGSGYTAPANGYAIVNVSNVGTGAAQADIAGVTVWHTPGGSAVMNTLYIGPGQTITLSSAVCTGVEFSNT